MSVRNTCPTWMCDRCDAEQENCDASRRVPSGWLRVELPDSVVAPAKDLCIACVRELRVWLNAVPDRTLTATERAVIDQLQRSDK